MSLSLAVFYIIASIGINHFRKLPINVNDTDATKLKCNEVDIYNWISTETSDL